MTSISGFAVASCVPSLLVLPCSWTGVGTDAVGCVVDAPWPLLVVVVVPLELSSLLHAAPSTSTITVTIRNLRMRDTLERPLVCAPDGTQARRKSGVGDGCVA